MANRLNLHRLIRTIHLYAACIILGFLLMYFITGFVMVHPGLISDNEQIKDSTEYSLTLPKDISDERIPEYLYGKFTIRGKSNSPWTDDEGNLRIDYNRPGHEYQIIVSPDRGKISVVTTKGNTHEIFVGFHRIKGYGGSLVYYLYVAMMDLTGIALIVFSISGLYLAFKMTKSIVVPLLTLSLGLGYTLIVIYLLML